MHKWFLRGVMSGAPLMPGLILAYGRIMTSKEVEQALGI